jgi:DNA-binding transcriptional regulator YiaG
MSLLVPIKPSARSVAKTTTASRILSAVHETARDLHAVGLINKRRMNEYDALCLDMRRLQKPT